MTRNQIAYHEHLEQSRHNQVSEKETERHNRATEKLSNKQMTLNYNLGMSNLAETKRSNLAREAETNRHNLVVEAQTNRDLDIKSRNSDISLYQAQIQDKMASIAAFNASENARSNKANEQLKSEANAEQHRSNIEHENVARFNAITSAGKAENERKIAQQNADTNLGNLVEIGRHNLAVEDETKRNNIYNQQIRLAELQETNTYHKYSLLINANNSMFNNLNQTGSMVFGRGGAAQYIPSLTSLQ